MPAINRKRSILLVVDFQSRLMPAIEDGASVIRNAKRLLDAAKLLDVQVLFTEQNAKGLGRTLPELLSGTGQIAHKMTFDACCAPDFLKMLPSGHDGVVSGCETHVCVLQTVLASWKRDGKCSSSATRSGRGVQKARRLRFAAWSEAVSRW